jgi:hypothetical protein
VKAQAGGQGKRDKWEEQRQEDLKFKTIPGRLVRFCAKNNI